MAFKILALLALVACAYAKPAILAAAPVVEAVPVASSYSASVVNHAVGVSAPYVAAPYVASPYVASPYVASPYVASPYSAYYGGAYVL